jgi:hypothetical protein
MPSSKPQRGADDSARYALPAMILGGALFAISFLPLFAGGRERWTKEQALELQQASMRIQELTHQLSTQTPDTATKNTSQDFKQALDHFESLQVELKKARSHSGSLGAVLRIAGLLLVVGGGVGYVVTRQKKTAELRPVHSVRTP